MQRAFLSVLSRAARLPASATWLARPVIARVSLWIQMLAIFLLLFAVAFGGMAYLFYTNSTDQAMTVLRNDLSGSATDLAKHLNASDLTTIQTTRRMTGDYTAVQAQLLYLKDSDPKIYGAYVFTRNPANPRTMLWVVTSNLHPTKRCRPVPGCSYDPKTHLGEMSAAFEHPTTSPGIYSDVYGSWLSGYAPIRDAKGTAVAIAEVDMTAQSVIDVQNAIKAASLRVFIIVLVCLLAIIPFMAAIITNPLKMVTAAARALELGTSPNRAELQRATQGHDEVSQLARVFSRMADEVQAREQRLKRQVEELKIEIDLTKQQSEVAEITETDFFRQLQQKAQRMRARTTGSVQVAPAT